MNDGESAKVINAAWPRIHPHDGVDIEVVWAPVREDFPALLAALPGIVDEEAT